MWLKASNISTYPVVGEENGMVNNETFFPHKLCKKSILMFFLSILFSDFFASLEAFQNRIICWIILPDYFEKESILFIPDDILVWNKKESILFRNNPAK